MKMKYIIGWMLLPFAFAACGDGDEIKPNAPVPDIVTASTVLTAPSTGTFVLSPANPKQEAFKLTWQPDVHRLENPSFDVQIDLSGNNFAGAKVLGSTTAKEYSVTAENLDTTIVKLLGQKVNKATKYDIRVITRQGATGIASSASNAFAATVTPYSGYPAELYLAFSDADITTAPQFTSPEDGIFEINANLKSGDAYKFVQVKEFDKAYEYIASAVDVDTEAGVTQAASGEFSPAFAGAAGSYKITVDFNTMTTKAAAVIDNLYLTGDAFIDWNWGDTDFELTPVNGAPGVFWAVLYLKAGGIKFSPVANWDNNFGIEENNADAIGEYTLQSSGNNLKIVTPGLYQIVVDYGKGTISVATPKVVLKGDAASGGWDATFATDPFTVSAANPQEMVSPAFAKDAELRMFVEIAGYDWWKCEFIVLDGKIVYRGNGGDQTRVPVTAGGKVTLNFNAGTGVIQ